MVALRITAGAVLVLVPLIAVLAFVAVALIELPALRWVTGIVAVGTAMLGTGMYLLQKDE